VWPVLELRDPLPENLRAYEDTDFLELRCIRCEWTATFSAVGANPKEIQRTTRAHVAECPARG